MTKINEISDFLKPLQVFLRFEWIRYPNYCDKHFIEYRLENYFKVHSLVRKEKSNYYIIIGNFYVKNSVKTNLILKKLRI